MLVLCAEHQLTCDCQTVNKVIRVFTLYHLMSLNTLHEYTKTYLITVFKYIKINAFINTLINTQYLNTIVFKYCATLCVHQLLY